MNTQRWLLLLCVIFLHIFIILGCIFGDTLYNSFQQVKQRHHPVSHHKKELRQDSETLKNYLFIQEKTFPYAMAFFILFLTILLLGKDKWRLKIFCYLC